MGHEIFAEVVGRVLGKRSAGGPGAAWVDQKYTLALVVVEGAKPGEGTSERSEFRAGVVKGNGDGGALNFATFFPFWGRIGDCSGGARRGECWFLGRGISTGHESGN